MMKKALVALAISGMAMSAQAGDIMIKEGFENVFSLPGKGWVFNNASTPGGATNGWTQGTTAEFEAHEGSPASFAGANFASAPEGGELNAWLISPEFMTTWGNTVSFWLRGAASEDYSDQIAFGLSQGGSELIDFAMNPAFTVSQDGWTQYTFEIKAREGKARLAFQYLGAADASNYVGLDSLVIADIPEPASAAILLAGAMGMVMSRRRKRS
ncbi:choice-of-anchor J domain-containing protein [Massilia suwonensis]|uniref:Choice-of-anchor J domain-containing protein n=1 Tax=Massilia suwonensis TaxID=648895 RepID=A0ABW0MTF7_9BURK